MKLKKAEGFVDEVSEERFERNRDILSKLVESDLKLIAWISWCLDLLFQNYSYEEMFDYIGKVTEEELKTIIVPVSERIAAEDNEGVIFDKFFKILKNDNKVTNLLQIENQLNPYPYEEIEARSLMDLCASYFWQTGNIISDKKHYRNVTAQAHLWIFPQGSKGRKNEILISKVKFPSKTKEIKIKTNITETDNIKPAFYQESNIYLFYLGNPTGITQEMLKETIQNQKLLYLLLLLDTIFGFELKTKERLNILGNIYNLKDRITEREVEIMNGFEEWTKRNYDEGFEQGENAQIEKFKSYFDKYKKNEISLEEFEKLATER